MLQRLRTVCAEFPLREKIVVVPSLAIGHQIGDALARSGTPWIHLRFETTRTIADAVVGLELAREGVSVVSRAQALAIVERACDHVLDDSSYFASLRGSPGLHRAIQRSIDDLRLAGIGGAFPELAFETPRKARDLAQILAAYESELAARRLIDRCGVVARAITRMERDGVRPFSPDAVWMASDEVELPAEESRLVRLASRGAVVVRTAGTRDDAASMPRLGKLTVASGMGEENEVRGALRAILRDAARHDDAELIYTSADPYLPLVFELCSEAGVEATFAEGIAVSFTAPGEACLAFLRWCGEGFNAIDLERAARAGALRSDALPSSTLARVLRAASIGWGLERHRTQMQALVAARSASVAQVDLSPEQRSARERDLEAAVAGAAWVEGLFEVVDLVLGTTVSLQAGREGDEAASRQQWARSRGEAGHSLPEGTGSFAVFAAQDDSGAGSASRGTQAAGATAETTVSAVALATAAKAFVEKFARTRNERDAMASAALVKIFGELAQLPDTQIELTEGTARLREAVLAQYVAASNPRPGHLHVAPLRSAAWSGRPRMFLLGLGEARFPGAGLQDPIVLDAEREQLNEHLSSHADDSTGAVTRQLALRGDAPLRAGERLRRCLSRAADADWTMSFSSMSLRDGREAFPAWDLLDIARAARGDETLTLEQLLVESTHARFIDESSPLGATEWWLSQRFVARRPDYADTLHREYPWLARGTEATLARGSAALTRFDGVVPIDPAAIDPRLTHRLLSASQVEKMAACPYGWFLRHVLRIQPPEELVRDPERWLDAASLGSMLHEIFEITMRRICTLGAKPSLDEHLPLMTEVAERTMLRWRAEVPPPNEAAYLRQHEDVLDTCSTFLRIEQDACRDSEAMFFEVPFGFSDAADHPAGMTEPLVLDLGGGKSVQLRGRIDRVDRTSRGTWQVWDYKTGSLFGWSGAWTFARGRKVQHAIYARALDVMLRTRGIDAAPVIEESGYLFPTPKGGGERISRITKPGELEQVLNRAFDVIASGFFAHPEDEGDCRFCDFAEVCGGAKLAAERARDKYAANAESELVTRLRRLHDVH